MYQASAVRQLIGREAVLKNMVQSFADGKFPEPDRYTFNRTDLVKRFTAAIRPNSNVSEANPQGSIVTKSTTGHSKVPSVGTKSKTIMPAVEQYHVVIGASGVGKTTMVLQTLSELKSVNGAIGVVYFLAESAESA